MKSQSEIEEMIAYHYGKLGAPKRSQFNKEVEAYREMITKVNARLNIDKIENEKYYKWALNRIEELLSLVNDSTPLWDENYVELELISLMVILYDEEHGYTFPDKPSY